MNLFNTILIGLREVWAHKFRSLLTMLGIVLGVAALVAMSALIQGMENGAREAMVAMGGADKVLLRRQAVPAYQEHLADMAPGRTLLDAAALRQGAPLLREVSPEMEIDDIVLTRADKRCNPTECVGATPAVIEMNLHTLAHGRFFNDIDEEKAHAVCVIGTGIRDELFGKPDEFGRGIIPIGETIYLSGQPFTIIGMFQEYLSEKDAKERALLRRGVLPKAEALGGPKRMRGFGRGGGGWAFYRKNMTVYIPLNTAWMRFRLAGDKTGIPDHRLSDIDFKVKDFDKLEAALQQARNVLLVTHKGIEDFTFETQENQLEGIQAQVKNYQMTGGFIAGISLLVGGIGIMNIMLASISERIREIGTCKALGATGGDIFVQIVVESVVLSVMGAAMGVGASYALVELLTTLSPTANTPIITVPAVLMGVGFSAAVGMFAGLLPAFKAASLPPIQALRYE